MLSYLHTTALIKYKTGTLKKFTNRKYIKKAMLLSYQGQFGK